MVSSDMECLRLTDSSSPALSRTRRCESPRPSNERLNVRCSDELGEGSPPQLPVSSGWNFGRTNPLDFRGSQSCGTEVADPKPGLLGGDKQTRRDVPVVWTDFLTQSSAVTERKPRVPLGIVLQVVTQTGLVHDNEAHSSQLVSERDERLAPLLYQPDSGSRSDREAQRCWDCGS